MPHVFKCDNDADRVAEELSEYRWTKNQDILRRNAGITDFRNNKCFSQTHINDLQPLIFAGHTTRINGEICYGEWSAKEFAEKFLSDFEAQHGPDPEQKKKITSLYFVSCETGLEIDNNPSLAQRIADELTDRGFEKAIVHAVAAPVKATKTSSMIVEVITRVGVRGVMDNTLGGFISACFLNAPQTKEHDRLREEHKRLCRELETLKKSNKPLIGQANALEAARAHSEAHRKCLENKTRIEHAIDELKNGTRFTGPLAVDPRIIFSMEQNIYNGGETLEQREERIKASAPQLVRSPAPVLSPPPAPAPALSPAAARSPAAAVPLVSVVTPEENKKDRIISELRRQKESLDQLALNEQNKKIKEKIQKKAHRLQVLIEKINESRDVKWKKQIEKVLKKFKKTNGEEPYRVETRRILDEILQRLNNSSIDDQKNRDRSPAHAREDSPSPPTSAKTGLLGRAGNTANHVAVFFSHRPASPTAPATVNNDGVRLKELKDEILRVTRQLNREMHQKRQSFCGLGSFFWMYEIETKRQKWVALNNDLAKATNLEDLRERAQRYSDDKNSRVMRNWRETGKVVNLIARILEETPPVRNANSRNGIN